jgi:pimeloyl-ACP methyl ester carboxylesterase
VRGRSATPFGVESYDNPETIRFKKYATGLQLTLQGAGIETGQTPREVVWAKDKARLDFYQQNKLAKGELELRGKRVELSKIKCPVLNIAGEKDFICPPSQAKPTMDLVSSEDKEMLVMDAGHVGLMASPVAKEELWPRIGDWLGPRSG